MPTVRIPLVCILHCRSPLIVSARRSTPLRNPPSFSLSSFTLTLPLLCLSLYSVSYLFNSCYSLFSTRFCNLLLILFFYFFFIFFYFSVVVVVAGPFVLVPLLPPVLTPRVLTTAVRHTAEEHN